MVGKNVYALCLVVKYVSFAGSSYIETGLITVFPMVLYTWYCTHALDHRRCSQIPRYRMFDIHFRWA